MAISIAYGIAIATVLTLLMLPMLLSLGNSIKQYSIWLWEGKKPTREEIEPAVEEMKEHSED